MKRRLTWYPLKHLDRPIFACRKVTEFAYGKPGCSPIGNIGNVTLHYFAGRYVSFENVKPEIFYMAWQPVPPKVLHMSSIIYLYYQQGFKDFFKQGQLIFILPIITNICQPPGQQCLGPHHFFSTIYTN